jgi:hypothetical protein
VIPAKAVRETLFQFNIPLTVDMQELLIRWCINGDNEGVLYHDLVNLLDWKSQPDMDTVIRLMSTSATDGQFGVKYKAMITARDLPQVNVFVRTRKMHQTLYLLS